MRIFIGWLFLYEGLCKLTDPYWTAAGYLLEAKWLFAEYFHSFAYDATALAIIDLLNIWGLILIGVALIAGVFSRFACYSGMVLMLLYYITNPPLVGLEHPMPTEGHYLVINKNIIIAVGLWVLALFPTSHIIGLDRFWGKGWLIRRWRKSAVHQVAGSTDKSKDGSK